MVMSKGPVFQIVLGLIGLALILLSVPSVHDNAVLGTIGIIGELLVILGAVFALLRGKPRSSK